MAPNLDPMLTRERIKKDIEVSSEDNPEQVPVQIGKVEQGMAATALDGIKLTSVHLELGEEGGRLVDESGEEVLTLPLADESELADHTES